ncbi:mucoidy inhibitor MuiA family protein [Corallococcus sp. M34]|uniref:mucoidy inhibitor MuiA family protein n=1 Tax=Citreicoccus inhibens TaxID=2849499 RepID=UPI001C21BEE8|nr:mucoidy inhibitor MuiA family protein [Citreicoccus inhibens]MBU8899819.1 mucoidy inhibitor MuiA family protein [Citreicoccus inhibens]
MLLLGLGLAVGGLLHAAPEAPITHVTLYRDSARVSRTATLSLTGSERVEFPLLPAGVDLDSIQVEAPGAVVAAVDIAHTKLPEHHLPGQETQRFLSELSRLRQSSVSMDAERDLVASQLQALRGIHPPSSASLTADVSKPLATPAAWRAATDFLVTQATKREARLRELEAQRSALDSETTGLFEEAKRLEEQSQVDRIQVSALLTGKGRVKATLSYRVSQGVRWTPRYELQFQPGQQRVQVSLSGRVVQNTGEDWVQSILTLSVAQPSAATSLPQVTTWTIGSAEHFIPHASGRMPPISGPPTPAPPRAAPSLDEVQSAQLWRQFEKFREPRVTIEEVTAALLTTVPPLSGAVLDVITHQPVQGLQVEAQALGGGARGADVPKPIKVLTNVQGRYAFDALPPGTYTLSFRQPDHDVLLQAGIASREGHPLRVNATLSSPADPVPQENTTPEYGYVVDGLSDNQKNVFGLNGHSYTVSGLTGGWESRPRVMVPIDLTPPGGWAPSMDPNFPAALAASHELGFTTALPETVRSATGERTLPLRTESWPVEVERHLVTSLSTEAYLVARIKSPASSPLPGGQAALFVGADPVGTATLSPMFPGEPFTLPLGVDRSVRATRTIHVVQSTQGLLSKDDVNAYEVTLEIPNPYPFPMPVQVVDQWPLSQSDDVKVKLVATQPTARTDEQTGELRWEHLVLPPSSKQVITFQYTVRRPKSWRLTQSP